MARARQSPASHEPATSEPQLRVAFVPFQDDVRTASVRLRALLPCRHLAAAGYRAQMLRPGQDPGDVDCVVFQKAYGTNDLALAGRLRERGTRIVFDLCDNHFFNPDDNPKIAERGERLQRMIDLADLVTAPTPQVAELAGSTPTLIVDDALDVPRIGPIGRAIVRGRRRRARGVVRLVWFGNSGSASPAFGLIHLGGLRPQLEDLSRTMPIQLTVISNSRTMCDTYFASSPFRVEYVEWRARSFGRHVAASDVCLLPVESNPFTVGKSNNRVVTSLMLGVPVVASRLPSYEEFADWIAFDQWAEHIAAVAADPVGAAARVEAARAHIVSTYTPEHVVAQWAAALQAVPRR